MKELAERVDLLVAEAEAMAELLLHVEEEAEEPALLRLRAAIVALLYLTLDKLRQALRETGRMATRCHECRVASAEGF